MSSSLYNVTPFPTTKSPRGARFASGLFAGVWTLLAKLWSTAPKRPATRAEEAEEVRAMARSVYATDPGFASDLFAAAARHEAGE
jgi:hypothetical protein